MKRRYRDSEHSLPMTIDTKAGHMPWFRNIRESWPGTEIARMSHMIDHPVQAPNEVPTKQKHLITEHRKMQVLYLWRCRS